MKAIFQKFVANPSLKNSFGESFCQNLSILNEYPDDLLRVSYMYVVQPHNVNILGTLHGGAICSLVDVTTTISNMKTSQYRHVSVSLSTEFFLPSVAGEQLRIQNIVRKTGKSLIFSDCEIFNKEDKMVAKGSHIKAFLRDKWDFMS